MGTIRDLALAKLISDGGGGGDITVEALNVTENGTITAPEGKAYTPVTVDVPNSYTAADEGKVVQNGALVAQTSRTVTENGTVDTTTNNQVVVNVQPVLEALSATQNGNYTPGAGVDGFSSVSVNVSGGGGGSAAPNAVNFRDYDGTIVQSYSAADFAELTAMPENPSHTGLTAQGWNWTLAKAQAYVAKYGRMEIGQMYITDDGKTRVYIHLDQGRTNPMLGVCPNGTVDVDWGDGTAHDTLTGTSINIVKWTPNHSYAAPGDYTIKLTVTGSMVLYGSNSSNQYAGLLRYTSSEDGRNRTYQNAIQMVEIGSGVTSIGDYALYNCYSLACVTIPEGVTRIGAYAFNSCYSLVSITIPDGVTSIGGSAFNYCYNLVSVTIPDGVTSIGTYAFNSCYSLVSATIPDGVTSISNFAFGYCFSLVSITIPDGVTSIGSNAFNSCFSLVSITIPDGVTSIGSNAFNSCYSLVSATIPDGVTSISSNAFNSCYSLVSATIPDGVTSIGSSVFQDCYGVAEYHLAPTNPPTLYNANAFAGIPNDCIIYVPYSADHSILDAYKAASNWSSYASYMREEGT